MTTKPTLQQAKPGTGGLKPESIVSATVTGSHGKETFIEDASAVQDEIHHRADAVTGVLSKIMEQPDSTYRWGLND